jgi:hypothetical protein
MFSGLQGALVEFLSQPANGIFKSKNGLFSAHGVSKWFIKVYSFILNRVRALYANDSEFKKNLFDIGDLCTLTFHFIRRFHF